MNLANLIDGSSALIVFGGTALATALRCGLADCCLTAAKLAQLGQTHFDADTTRAELAIQVQEIHQDGLLRAAPRHSGDREFDEATDALFGTRSVAALLETHEQHRAGRMAQAERAVRTLAQAAELAPVFGLAGTLVSLSQLPANGLARGAFTEAISMAVLTTLYGLLCANLLLAPLARVVERAAQAEELARQQVIDWLAGQVAIAVPAPRAEQRCPTREAELI